MWLLVAIAVGLLAGCSKEKERQVAMQKRFATIDSNFVAAIMAANSNEPVMIDEQLHQFSNAIMSMHLTLTNLDMATNELQTEIGNEGLRTELMIKFVQELSDFKRSMDTNEMLLAKLQWFYTNQTPVVESAPSNDVMGRIIGLSDQLLKARNEDIVNAGLNIIRQELAKLTNTISPTEEDIKRQKKEARMAEIERQRQASAIYWSHRRERDAVKSTMISTSGTVFQIVNGGMLFSAGSPIYQNIFIEDCALTGLSDGSPMNAPELYPIGSYHYANVSGGTQTVKRFTVSLDRAVQWHRDNP